MISISTELIIETIGKYWIQFLMSAIGTSIVMLWRKLNAARKDQKKAQQEQKVENETIKNAVKALLADRLLQSTEFFLHEEKISDVALNNILAMNHSYQQLGNGNQAIDLLVEEVKKLPKRVHNDT